MEKLKLKKNIHKSISVRWFVNSIGVVVVLLVIFILIMSFSIQSYVYNGIQQVLIGRSDELLNIFESSGGSDFATISRAYIENFPDKNEMEIMSISDSGTIQVTSTGFAPDLFQEMPDYESAINSESGFGYWIGTLETGEKVMAITRVVENSWGETEGSLRYLVSVTEADNQIRVFVAGLIVIGFIITLVITFSGIYFIRSIVVPVSQITDTAKVISSGDFDVRIKKNHDDEIGELIDSINLMAGELGNSERMKNDFISSVSHELRTPLTAINGWAETLQSGGLDKQTADKGINVIIKESQRLSGIVEELLDFSRLQSGRLNLRLSRTDLLAEIDEAVFLFTERAKAEQKTLIYEESTNLPIVMVDANRIKQVFVNIIDNALKYTPSEGKIIVKVLVQNNNIKVIVSDNGCGIEKEHMPHIKKKFYKANQIVRGSGIGLAVANEIIEMHNGKLEIESEINVGTTVTISIPAANLERGLNE